MHGAQHGALVHSEPAGQPTGVLGAHGAVANARDDGGRHPQCGDLPFDRVEIHLGDGRTDRELEHGLAGVDEIHDRLVTLADAEVARIHPVRLDGDVGLGDELLILLEGPQGSLLAGGVSVEGEDDLSGQSAPVSVQAQTSAPVRIAHHPAHDLHVLRTEGRAARCDGGGHPCEVSRHHVGVPLDHHHAPLGRDVLAREVQAVEHLGLVVDRGLGGVEVLRALIRLQQTAGTEADRVPRDVPDRPDEPPAETVVDAALPLGDDARSGQLILGEAALAQHGRDRVPALGSESDAEALGRGAVEAPLGEETASHFRRRGVELLAVVLLGDGVRIQQPTSGAEIRAVAAASGGLLVVQLHAVAPGEHLDGLDEAEVVDLLHERDHVTPLAAAEAVPVAQLRADVEGGGLLVVEGAQALHRADPARAQRDVLAHDLVETGALSHQLHVGTPDQSLGQLLTAPIRVLAAGCRLP